MVQALIDFAQPQGAADGVRLCGRLTDPIQILQADSLDEVSGVLAAVQAAALAGHWCIGYLTYEAAPAFDAAFQVHVSHAPLAWFAVFEPQQWQPLQPESVAVVQAEWHTTGPDATLFVQQIGHIQQAIAAGECYQINHTAPVRGTLSQGDAPALYAALRRAQPGGYAMYLDTGMQQVLSVSPELFFDWDGEHILVRPMKGTAPRGGNAEADAAQAQALQTSTKERAENVMIVDLIRNDLSRIALLHTVCVPQLFQVQALPTVWQMTSDVTAQTRPHTTLLDVFTALFPCGSITGAPKVQAMRLIHQLEAEARGVYCGALGVVRPGGHATFNVAIRTVTLQGADWRCGIGSGITSSSTAAGEWQEWQHKRVFLERASMSFEILETLALEQGVFRHLEQHLARMHGAALHFAYPWQAHVLRQQLAALSAQHPTGAWRVRVLLSATGDYAVQSYAMEPSPHEVALVLAPTPLSQADSEFVRYKTTRRQHYEQATIDSPGVFDTVLWNERGELTECTRGNLALCIDGHWYTPALGSGLLPGVGRSVALAEGRVTEAVLHVADLQRATQLAFVNSLRGWIPARLL